MASCREILGIVTTGWGVAWKAEGLYNHVAQPQALDLIASRGEDLASNHLGLLVPATPQQRDQ